VHQLAQKAQINMKIRAAKFYVGVNVNKTIRTHLNGDEGGLLGMELLPNVGLAVHSEKEIVDKEHKPKLIKETVIVPFANVQYCTAAEYMGATKLADKKGA
jgi:hypothetical protein